jgi:deoxycytidylate deaminase
MKRMKIWMTMTRRRLAFFNAARAVSKLSDFPRVAVGSVAVYKHRIISSGCNSRKTDTLQKKYNRYRFQEDTPHCVHAEVACLKPLIGSDIEFRNVDLYVHRENKKGIPMLARPCPSCTALVKELGIRNIYYTNNGGYSHEDILN